MIVFSGINVLGRMAVPSTREGSAPTVPVRHLKEERPRDLYGELKPLWLTLLFVMAAPIQRSKSGVVQSRWDSWSGLVTLMIFAFNWFVLYNVFPVQFKVLKDSDTFPEQVFASIFVFTLNVHIMIPLTAWPFAKRLAKYLNDWTEFQAKYAKVAGRQLEFHLRDRARILAFCCMLTLPQTTLQFMTISNAPFWHAAAYIPVSVHSLAFVGLWHCNCSALRHAALRMSEDFGANVSSGRLVDHIRRYRELWSSLQKLTVALSMSQSAIMLHVALLLMSLTLISAFGMLGAAVAGVSTSRIIVLLSMATTTHIELLVACSAGYRVADTINVKMRNQLLSLSQPRSALVEHEVMLFLREVSMRPACIRVIGYINVDRLMYVKIVAAMIRNFLVLLQFAYTGAKAAVKPTTEAPPHDDFYDFLR